MFGGASGSCRRGRHSPFMDLFPVNIRARTLFFFSAIVALSTFALGHPRPAVAFNVIVVKSAALRPYQEVLRGFRDGCDCDVRELNLENGAGEKEVLQQSPDAVVAIGTGVFKKIRAIRDLPLIYTMVIPSEVSASLRPNISGVSMDIAPETYVVSMREAFPQARRIGLLYDPKNTAAFVAEAAKAMAAAGLELVAGEVGDPSQYAALLGKMTGKIDLFWMLPDPTVVSAETVDSLLRFSFQSNVPVFSFSRKYVEMGAVAALDVDPYEMGVQAGHIVNRLSAGRPAAIREYSRPSDLTINLKVAKKMGIRIGAGITTKVITIE
jgi:putative ABC transport system substrate-binding protein